MPDMPWEDRPAGSKEVMWRYSANPIIRRDALSTSNSIFNSAVVPFKKGKYNYAGVFRCDDTNRRMRIHAAFSVDGIRWDICEEDFKLVGADPEIGEWVYGYDPRLRRSTTNITSRGATATTARRSASHGRTILRRSTSWKTPSSPSTATGFCSPQDQRPFRHAVASERQRAYGFRGHLLFGESRHGVLGPPPACDVSGGFRGVGMAVHEDRCGPVPIETRRAGCCSTTACCARATVMSMRSVRRCSTSTSRGSHDRPQRPVPDIAARDLRADGRRSERHIPLRVAP